MTHPFDRIIARSNREVDGRDPRQKHYLRHATYDARGYLWLAPRVKVAYRGWVARPFIRRRPIKIGQTRLYCWGPLAIFVHPRRNR